MWDSQEGPPRILRDVEEREANFQVCVTSKYAICRCAMITCSCVCIPSVCCSVYLIAMWLLGYHCSSQTMHIAQAQPEGGWAKGIVGRGYRVARHTSL